MENTTPKDTQKRKNTTLQVVLPKQFKEELLEEVGKDHPYATSDSQKANIIFHEYLNNRRNK